MKMARGECTDELLSPAAGSRERCNWHHSPPAWESDCYLQRGRPPEAVEALDWRPTEGVERLASQCAISSESRHYTNQIWTTFSQWILVEQTKGVYTDAFFSRLHTKPSWCTDILEFFRNCMWMPRNGGVLVHSWLLSSWFGPTLWLTGLSAECDSIQEMNGWIQMKATKRKKRRIF